MIIEKTLPTISTTTDAMAQPILLPNKERIPLKSMAALSKNIPFEKDLPYCNNSVSLIFV